MATRQPNTVSFTPEQLQEFINQAIATHEAAKAAHAKTEAADKVAALTISAFKRAGFKPEDCKPRENIRTYNLWLQENRRVKPGEKSVAVKGLRLFHITQTEPISEAEKQAFLAQKEARKTADKLPVVSPVTPISAAHKGRGKSKSQPQPQA